MLGAPLIDFRRMPQGLDREKLRTAAYQALFGSELGRVVLRDMADEVGMGAQRGAPSGVAGLRDYQAGCQDAVIGVAERAGVDVTVLALSLAQHDEGQGFYDGGSGFDDEG